MAFKIPGRKGLPRCWLTSAHADRKYLMMSLLQIKEAIGYGLEGVSEAMDGFS